MYMGKDLTEVRSLHRPLVPDGVGPGQHEPTFLQAIAIKARADKRHVFRTSTGTWTLTFSLPAGTT
jgi:hypothetical protein